MEMNIYIGFWTLKMKCTQYGLYGQAAFKNLHAIFILKVERNRQGAWASSKQWRRRAGVGPNLEQMWSSPGL